MPERPVTPPDAATDPDRFTRWSTRAVVVALAVGAAYVSYGHAYDLIHSHGESATTARIGAGTIDGLVFACGMVIRAAARQGVRAPGLAYAGAAVGMLATIGANVAHGVSHGPIGALVSAWPAVALIIAYEVLMRLDRISGTAPAPETPAATENRCPHGVAATAMEAALTALEHGRDCLGDEPSQRHLAATFNVDRKKLADAVKQAAQPEVAEPEYGGIEPSLNGQHATAGAP